MFAPFLIFLLVAYLSLLGGALQTILHFLISKKYSAVFFHVIFVLILFFSAAFTASMFFFFKNKSLKLFSILPVIGCAFGSGSIFKVSFLFCCNFAGKGRLSIFLALFGSQFEGWQFSWVLKYLCLKLFVIKDASFI